MAALGACIVGIGSYAYAAAIRPGDLQFAGADADAIETYLKTCWPGESAAIARVGTAEATAAILRERMAGLAAAGPYDLFVLYFSGHGVVGPDQTGLLVQPEAGADRHQVVSPADLDQLLGAITARRTVCIFDCCFAEAVVRPMAFFRGLGTDEARLFIASSRADQRTWEDEAAGHGIFSAFLLDVLNTGDVAGLAGVRDQLDVDSELFPLLCDQVPLFVLERKNQKQEPVKGGVSVNRVSLPVARAARKLRNRTALQTALHRVRQLLIGGAIAAVVFLAFAYELAYYPEQDQAGHVVLYHGTRWLAPVLKVLPSVRVDTGISANDLSSDDAKRQGVQAGDHWGIWSHKSGDSYRAWYDLIRPSLSSEAAGRYDVWLGARFPKPSDTLPADPQPAEVEAAGRSLLDGAATPAEVQAVLRPIPGADWPETFEANNKDFRVLDLTPDALESFANALKSAAVVDPAATFPAFVGYLKACQSWVFNNSDDQRGRGQGDRVRGFAAETLAIIAQARVDRGLPALDDPMRARLRTLAAQGFGGVVEPALARVSPSAGADPAGVEAALAAFHGDMTDQRQLVALGILRESLDGSDKARSVVAQVDQAFRRQGPSQATDLNRFLMVAGRRKSLPAGVVQDLVAQARAAGKRRELEFEDVDLARVLAAGMSQVPVQDRPVVYHLVEALLAQMPTVSMNAQTAAMLADQGLDTPTIVKAVETQATTAGPYKPADPSTIPGALTGTSILSSRGVWVDALAAIAKRRQLPPTDVDVLVGRSADPALQDRIVEGLAAQQGFQVPEGSSPELPKLLRRYPRDAAHRQLIAEVAAQRLASLPRAKFDAAMAQVRQLRAVEVEPEVRLALGELMVDATMMRGRMRTPGLDLVD